MQLSTLIDILCATSILALPAQEELNRKSYGLAAVGRRAIPAMSPPQSRIAEGHTRSSIRSGLADTTRSSNDRFASASGQFIVPEPHLPKAADNVKNGDFTAWIWVGLCDGPHILQAGITVNAHKSPDGSESNSYGTWYEWYPANGASSTTSSQFPVVAGDSVEVLITLSSPTSGYVVWTNLRTHHVYRKDMSIPNNSPDAIVATEADWIVKDPTNSVLGGPVPFPNFGAVTFTNLVTVIRGQALGNPTSRTIEIVQTDKSTGKLQNLANATFDGSSVQVTYTGP
jgi:hypothetical protein